MIATLYAYLFTQLIFHTLLSYLSSTPQDLLFIYIILLRCFNYVFQISITYHFVFISAYYSHFTFKVNFLNLDLRPCTFSLFFYICLLYDVKYFQSSHNFIAI